MRFGRQTASIRHAPPRTLVLALEFADYLAGAVFVRDDRDALMRPRGLI
jgi:hypothetical protein